MYVYVYMWVLYYIVYVSFFLRFRSQCIDCAAQAFQIFLFTNQAFANARRLNKLNTEKLAIR